MKILDEKRMIIDYVSKNDTFILQDENRNEEKVGIFKMNTSLPESSNSIKDEYTVQPI